MIIETGSLTRIYRTDELTVYENVELPLVYNKTPSSERKVKKTPPS